MIENNPKILDKKSFLAPYLLLAIYPIIGV
jgi:hypothetical protein